MSFEYANFINDIRIRPPRRRNPNINVHYNRSFSILNGPFPNQYTTEYSKYSPLNYVYFNQGSPNINYLNRFPSPYYQSKDIQVNDQDINNYSMQSKIK